MIMNINSTAVTAHKSEDYLVFLYSNEMYDSIGQYLLN